MKIIIDAMGGDRAPGEIVAGACAASLISESELILVGREDAIKRNISLHECRRDRIEIVNADDVITMEDDPMSVVRAHRNSSMGVGFKLLNDAGDAFISAGNTGALHAGATLVVRNIQGIRRAAIATILPFERPMLLMDSGANVNVTPEYLLQWAYTGQVYMKHVMGVKSPRVGLLNNGTEECKGGQLQREAYALLSNSKDISFVGNIESRELPSSPCDIIVTDGFTGNIVLKLIEGMSKYMFGSLKKMFGSSLKTKLSYIAMKDQLREMKHRYDPSEHGGAPILGISKPVIKAHGSSDARAIMNAVRQAERFVSTGAIREIENAVGRLSESAE